MVTLTAEVHASRITVCGWELIVPLEISFRFTVRCFISALLRYTVYVAQALKHAALFGGSDIDPSSSLL